MREHADVAAHAHGDARRQSRGEAGALLADRIGLRRTAGPAPIMGDRVGGGEGGAEGGAALAHHPEHLRCALIAMFDRIDPRHDRAPHALGGRGMGGDDPARRMGDFNARAHLLHRKGRPRGLAGPPAIIRIEFDHVRPGADLPPHGSDQGRAVRFLRAEQGRFRVRRLGPVAPRRNQRPRRDQQARTWDDALLDRRLQPDIGIARAFGAEIAEGGEAGHQRRPRMGDGAGGAQRQRLAQHLIVPARLIIGVEEEMAVALDHPRHQGHAWQVEHPRAVRNGEVRPDRLDPFAADQHLPAFVRPRVDAVEHPRGTEQQGRSRCVALRRERRGEAEHQQGEEQPHGVAIASSRKQGMACIFRTRCRAKCNHPGVIFSTPGARRRQAKGAGAKCPIRTARH